ncbi:MAG: short-chain dehydrogenase/reductase [Propionibacteriales bacterium]|nr:short-chain dehydrogenase/reductase [Propionibacteriales bacterium]
MSAPLLSLLGLPGLPAIPGVPAVLRADPRIELRGRVVLVTGAAEGIGRACAGAFVARGARVVLVDVAADLLRTTVADLPAGQAHGIVADVRDRAAMAAAVEEATATFGRLDVVVANAGVTPLPATIRTTDLDDFDRVVGINLTGVVNTVHPAIDEVMARGGHILVVASVAAFAPGLGGVSYGASKAGVEQVGRALRIELGSTEATAGVAYFGVVATSLVRKAFDEDPLGREVDGLLPPPMRKRITPEQAAATIVAAVERRSARAIAPKVWEPYALMREVVNRRFDEALRASPRIHRIYAAIEERAGVRM